MEAHLASLRTFLAARGIVLPDDATLRRCEEHVFALPIAPALEIRFHLAGSRHAVYRRGRQLGISYVSPGRADLRVVDAACEFAFSAEDAIVAALTAEAARSEKEGPSKASPTRTSLAAFPAFAAAVEALGLSDVTLTHTATRAVEIAGAFGVRRIRLEVRPLLTARNPFLAGRSLSITLPGIVEPGPGAEVVEALARTVVASEDELLPLFAAPGHVVRMKMYAGRQTVLPVGKLVRFLDGELREKRGLIYLTSPCYANCVFCGEETTREYVLSEVSSVVRSIRERDFAPERVAIGGYEPLSHPGILEMISELRTSGIDRVELMTTGIPLGNLRFVDALLDAGLTDVAVPIYGVDAITNDLVMRKAGAFAATVAGLDRLHERGCGIKLHTIVVQQNLDQVDAMADLARSRWNASFVAAPPRAKQVDFAAIAVRTEQLASVQRAPLLGVPFCLHPRMAVHPDVRADAALQLTLEDIADSMRFYFSQELLQLPECGRCVHRVACTGVMAAQLEIEPNLRLQPFE